MKSFVSQGRCIDSIHYMVKMTENIETDCRHHRYNQDGNKIETQFTTLLNGAQRTALEHHVEHIKTDTRDKHECSNDIFDSS